MAEISVITFPLKTEKWQEDVLFKRFEICRQIYNSMLGYELKQYRKMLRRKEYKESIDVIYSAYQADNDKEKKKIKASGEYKTATKTQKELLKEYGFSEFSFESSAIRFAEHFKTIIPTKVAQMSIGIPMWTAFDKLLFGNGEMVYFKKYDTFSSIVTDGRSAIRIVSEDGKTTKKMDSRMQYYCVYTSKEGKNLKMPLKIDRKDLYMLEMMERDIHTVRICRKKVKGNYKYSVQLSVTGAPAIKYNKDGEELHPVGNKKLGVYIDTTSITITDDKSTKHIDISFKSDIEDKKAELQRYMDASRRANNPDNFNEDGTIKKGIIKDGKRTRLIWNNSKGYLKAKDELANLLRVQAEQRKLRANKIANEIMSLGADICINDYPFQAAAMRKKFPEGEELDEKGKPKKKKKAGKKIGENAPFMIVTILDNKLKGRGYAGVKKVKLKDVDYQMSDYRSYYSNVLYRMIAE